MASHEYLARYLCDLYYLSSWCSSFFFFPFVPLIPLFTPSYHDYHTNKRGGKKELETNFGNKRIRNKVVNDRTYGLIPM